MNDPTDTLWRFAGLRVIHAAPMVELLTGFDKTGRPVTLVALTEPAGSDPSWCAAFADAVGQDSASIGPTEAAIHEVDLYATRPWAASYPEPGRRGAERLLSRLPGALADGADPTELLPRTGVGDVLRAQEAQRTSGALAHSVPPIPPPPPGQPGDPRQPSPVPPPPGGLGHPTQPISALLPAGARPYGSPTPIPGYPPPPPRPTTSARIPLLIGLITAVTALLFVGGGIGYALMSNRGAPVTTPTVAAPKASSSSPRVEASASPSRSPLPTTKPTLKTAPAVRVVGPVFQSGEKTYTFAFAGWPFAFRSPGTWGCVRGSIDTLPDAQAWACRDEQNANSGHRMNIMLRRCPTTCTYAEQATMDKAWFDEPRKARRFDATTGYVEQTTSADVYKLDMSHFFPATPGGPLQWQVGVFVESPVETKAVVQKVVNEVRGQTP